MPTKTKLKKGSLATNKKKRGILSRINFSSRKTQFITAILIVGLMGGGWFTYKSFAASWTYTPENKNLEAIVYYDQNGTVSKCSTATIPDPSKNNAQVILLGCEANHAFAQIRTLSGYIGSWGLNRQYRVCAIVKGSGSSVNLRFYYPAYTGGSTDTYISNQISSTGYKTVCSPYRSVSRMGPIGGLIDCKKETSCQIAVRSMTIEQL